jgi:hypothetical protein
MASPALRSLPTTPLSVNMVAPTTPFVQSDGRLTEVSFRFLFRLWNALSEDVTAVRTLERDSASKDEAADLARQLVALEARVAALEARP